VFQVTLVLVDPSELRARVVSEVHLVAMATKGSTELLVFPASPAPLAPEATTEDLDLVANQVPTVSMVPLEKSASEVLPALPVLLERLATRECADLPVFPASLE